MKVILGAMTFGERIWGEDVKKIVNRFLELGYNEIDTAYVYNDGKSEEILGNILKNIDRKSVKIASKVNPRISGRLDEYAVKKQLEESLIRLNTDYIDTYYLHFPDKKTALEPVLECIAKYHKEGKIIELGVSNFPVYLIDFIVDVCKKNNWLMPTVYEGLYNPLSRKIESALSTTIDQYGMRLNTYNPLAGGLMTDKYSAIDQLPLEGRFVNRPNYCARYWKPSYFAAIAELRKISGKYGISITESAMRWLSNHSMLSLKRGDGIIVGVSKYEHLDENINYINKDSLPEELVNTFELTWELCKKDSPEYFKFYEG